MERNDMVALGHIEGKLDMIVTHLDKQDERLSLMDERLHKVEIKAAKTGALSGAIVSVVTTIMTETLRHMPSENQ